MLEELVIVFYMLPKSEARVNHELAYAEFSKLLTAFFEVAIDFFHDISIVGAVLHCLRQAFHVHDGIRHAAFSNYQWEFGVQGARRDVVDHIGAAFNGLSGDV